MRWKVLKPRNIRRGSRRGYGLALLMIFISSSILVGASLQLMAGPTTMGYLGQSTQDNLLAKQVASLAINAAITDIQSKLNAGQTVDLSYRLPAAGTTSVTIPTYPGSGDTTTLGSYYVTLSKARGSAFVLQVNATANSTTVQVPKFIQMARNNNFILDSLPTGISAAYSVRRLRSGYTGAAIRVRRSSDNAEQDIGFTPNGDLDTDSLVAFLGGASSGPLSGGNASEFPLDNLPAASAAYSVRKLRSAYAGNAMKVARSNDGDEKDIGFNADGSFNTTALTNHVGTGSTRKGRVSQWKDQTGNGRFLNKETTDDQPLVVISGKPITANGRQTIRFSQHMMYSTGTASNPTMQTISAVVQYGAGTEQRLLHTASSLIQTNTTQYFNPPLSTAWYYNTGSPPKLWVNGVQNYSHNGEFHILTTIRQSTLTDSFSVSKNGSYKLNGSNVSELIIFPTALSDADRAYLEKNQAAYYNISAGAGGVGYITTWYDQSGNGRHAVQATAANQPEIVVLGPGATAIRPAIKFNGTTNSLRSATGMPTSADYTKAAVFTYAVSGADQSVLGGDGNHDVYVDSDNKLQMYHDTAFAGTSTALTIDTLYAIQATFVQSSKLGTIYQGGVAAGSSVSPNINDNATIQLGQWGMGGYYMTGTLSEAMVFSRVLNAAERSVLYDSQQSYFGAL